MPYLEEEFFKFVHERQLIWHKRFVLKEKAPWTDDEILKTYKIINVYRELDRGTIYIINRLKDVTDREKILINLVFYRFFNQFNLYEKLKIDTFDKIDDQLKSQLQGRFADLKSEGKPIFNNAYLISGVKGEAKHVSILNNLKELDTSEIIRKIDESKTAEDSLEVLTGIPMVGRFLACEIWTDLSYLGVFKQKWTDNDFVNVGPGAKWGLEIIYGKMNRQELNNKLNYLCSVQQKFLKGDWKKIAYKEAYSNYPFLSLTNIEGALCEFRKYWNIKHGRGRRKYFKPLIN